MALVDELRQMLAEGSAPESLGQWLSHHASQIIDALKETELMTNQPHYAAAHLEQALTHLKCAIKCSQENPDGRRELIDLAERLAIIIDSRTSVNPSSSIML